MEQNQSPMYLKIMDELKAKIETGAFDYDVPLCTERSISEKYGVSRITAKRAIDELENLGILYRKRGVGSFVARSPEKEKAYTLPAATPASRSVALMLPFSMTSGGIFGAVQSASDILAAAGIYLTLHVYTPGIQQEADMLAQLHTSPVDGVIYYPSTTALPTEILDRFVAEKRPVITLDKPHEFLQYSSVVSDNFGGGRLVTDHILGYGHKNTCYLSRYTCEEISSIRDRYAGYKQAAEEKGCAPRFVKIDIPMDAPFDYPMLKHVINTLRNEGVTAVLCENDEVAFYVHMCCRSLSLRPPEDLSITGFDNITWATTGSAHITSVEQDFPSIGRVIAGILLQPQYIPVHKTVDVRLVPRSSTGPAPTEKRG